MKNQRVWMGIAGVGLVVGFFLPWLDLGVAGASGWDIVRSDLFSLTSVILLLCPLLGVALAIAAFGKQKEAAAVSIAAGGGVLGYTFYKLAWGFVKISGVGLWMVLGAAAAALVLGLSARRTRG